MVYKLLEDSRNEVKVKTEKLLKKLYFLLGQQLIEQCPSNKLQRVIDVVINNGTSASNSSGTGGVSLAAGGGTFGAVGAANLIVQSYSSSANNNNNSKNKH